MLRILAVEGLRTFAVGGQWFLLQATIRCPVRVLAYTMSMTVIHAKQSEYTYPSTRLHSKSRIDPGLPGLSEEP